MVEHLYRADNGRRAVDPVVLVKMVLLQHLYGIKSLRQTVKEVKKGFIKADVVFIDATHMKASANKQKKRKVLAKKTARIYDEKLREEINADREAQCLMKSMKIRLLNSQM